MVQGSLRDSGLERDSAESTVIVRHARDLVVAAPQRPPRLPPPAPSPASPRRPQAARIARRELAARSPGLLVPECTAARAELHSGTWSPFLLTLPSSRRKASAGKCNRKAFPTVVKCSRPQYPGPSSGLWLGGEWCRLAAAAAWARSGRSVWREPECARTPLGRDARAASEPAVAVCVDERLPQVARLGVGGWIPREPGAA